MLGGQVADVEAEGHRARRIEGLRQGWRAHALDPVQRVGEGRDALDLHVAPLDLGLVAHQVHGIHVVAVRNAKVGVKSMTRGLFGDTVEEIDAGLGDIMKTLKELGQEKNTMIVFTSDNGPWLPFREHGGTAGLLREGKGTTWEGGFRVPLVVRVIVGRGWGQGPQHGQNLQALFAHIPGLKVVAPTTPQDAKGMLLAAIEDDDPVLFALRDPISHLCGAGVIGFALLSKFV